MAYRGSIMELLWNHGEQPLPNLSIKNVPPETVRLLRERAAANHRSLQGELMALVTRAVNGTSQDAGEPSTARSARRGHKPIEQIASEHLQRVRQPISKGGRSVDLIRADRDAR